MLLFLCMMSLSVRVRVRVMLTGVRGVLRLFNLSNCPLRSRRAVLR